MKTICSPIKEPVFPYDFRQPKDKIAFLDIETTGLSPNASSLYLIGLMCFDSDKKEWQLYQWFADNYQSEKAILETFLTALTNIDYLYHFNGKTFDIPYVLKKCKKHAITLTSHCESLLNDGTGEYSIDLLTKIRSLRHALMLDKCNQTSIERWLGIKRTDTFTGGELISVYSEYMQQKILNPANSEKLEKVLLLHNHDDIEMMLNLCSLLTYDEYLSKDYCEHMLCEEALTDLKVTLTNEQTIEVTLPLKKAVPKTVHLTAAYPATSLEQSDWKPALCSMLRAAQLTFKKDHAHFIFPVYPGTLKFFLPNPKDYYYLIKEDMAVHKSVAEFVDSAFRKKATAANCYIKKEAVFIPNLAPASKHKNADSTDTSIETELSPFYLQHKDKLSFFKLPEKLTENKEFWKAFLSKQMLYFRN